MTTNILATIIVSLVTNVLEWDNGSHGCRSELGNGIYLVCALMGCEHTLTIEATEKTKTITVKEVTVVKFSVDGEEEKIISSKSERWVKSRDWIKSPIIEEISYPSDDLVDFTIGSDVMIIAP